MPAPVHPITAIAPTVSAILGVRKPSGGVEQPIADIAAELSGCQRVAIVAPDALGLTVWQHWREQMPFLTSLHQRCHLVLRSVSPAVTPVNFAALVTGAVPEVHGVRSKDDSLRCESLFDVIREAGGRSAGVGRAGFTGGQLLARYADLSGRTEDQDDDAVVEMAVGLAHRHSPCFIIAQLGEPDTVFHRVGPSSPEADPVVLATDERLRQLVTELTGLGYGVIVLADHSQHDLPDGDPSGYRGWHDDLVVPEDALVPCTWVRVPL